MGVRPSPLRMKVRSGRLIPAPYHLLSGSVEGFQIFQIRAYYLRDREAHAFVILPQFW